VSTWGLVLRIFGGMAAGAAAVALALGCVNAARPGARVSGVLGAGQERGAWASPTELAWLKKLGRWEAGLLVSLRRAGRASSNVAAEPLLAPVRSCRVRLRSHVGSPPTPRLRRALALVEAACAHLSRAADASSADAASTEGRRGGELLLRADQLVPPGELRSLPVIAGDSVDSRIDPKFSAIASDLAGKQVEVRCWSRVDWSRLLREEKAYTLHRIDDSTLGFAGVGGARDNLAPDVCDGLGELAYHQWAPRAEDTKLLLATAVVTLTHEPQHSKGIAVEARAECNAIQLMKGTARKLGATPAYAAELQRVYWAHYGEELPAYRSSQCRDGGAYDLNRASKRFP
jgi:hypothetical protein